MGIAGGKELQEQVQGRNMYRVEDVVQNCGEESHKEALRIASVTAARCGVSGRVTAGSLRRRIEEQGYRCALTGWSLDPTIAHVDHIAPISKGGQHSLDNIQIVHERVNIAKGTLTQQEFIEMCRAVWEWSRGEGGS